MQSTATRWALVTSAAFAIAVVAHEAAHFFVGLAVRLFWPDWEPLSTVAGPVASLLILMGSILWLIKPGRSSRPGPWPFAYGLTAASRLLFVWILAGPFLLGWRTNVIFDELTIARWIGVHLGLLMAAETVPALGGAVWLVRAIPIGERRAALIGISAAVAVVGTAVMLIDPRV